MTVANEVEKRSAAKKPAAEAGANGSGASGSGAAERQRLRMMMLIRRFEERTYQEYSRPRELPDGTKEMKIGGFLHLYSGQEAIAVGISSIFDKSRDALINGYR